MGFTLDALEGEHAVNSRMTGTPLYQMLLMPVTLLINSLIFLKETVPYCNTDSSIHATTPVTTQPLTKNTISSRPHGYSLSLSGLGSCALNTGLE
jgi:hypothetical protein